MRTGALVVGVVVSVLLLAAAGGLYVLAGSSGPQHYRTSIELVRQIQQHSSSWSIEIARVKVDPMADLDSLTVFVPRMDSLEENLSQTAAQFPGLPEQLDDAIRSYLNLVDARQERIEQFKTDYAVVRQSERYLPLAAANVARRAKEANDGTLVRRISILTQNMNLYLANPTSAVESRLNADLEGLRESTGAYPGPIANAMANLLQHADILLSRHGPVNDLFQQATSNEVSGLADQLTESLEIEFGRASTRATIYERGSLAAVGALALFWLILVLYERSRRAAPVGGLSGSYPTAPLLEPTIGDYDPQYPVAQRDEFDFPPIGAVDREPAFESETRISAETATMYRFIAERAGESITAFASRVAARIDRLGRTHEAISRALQSSDVTVELPDGADLDAELEAGSAVVVRARRELGGITTIARRLGAFPGPEDGEAARAMVDVNACVEEAIAATGAGRAAEVVKGLGDVPGIFASKTEIRLLLAQILDNSVHAVEGLDARPGAIDIKTARKDEEVLITILDNGIGIAPERRNRIFTPFYTTRVGAMGLGLTVARHLAEKYEGGIKLNSAPGQGTLVRINLRARPPAPRSAASSGSGSGDAKGDAPGTGRRH